MSLSSEKLQQQLAQLPVYSKIKTWWLAYSGGVDSRVLLHLLAPLKLNLQVVYIDHGLQSESAAWGRHCAGVCDRYGLPFQVLKVDVDREHDQGLESAARSARYQALGELMGVNDALLTAQHQDDQGETFLLQLFRGAGAAGLASMAPCSSFARGWQLRPLLSVSRRQIMDFARQHQLQWVEDPSNRQLRFDRNFLRQHILPQLTERWPCLSRTLSMAAGQQAENQQLLEELGAMDIQACQFNGGLSLEKLAGLSEARQRNCIRCWLEQQGLPRPPRRVMAQFLGQFFTAAADANPVVRWEQVAIGRYQGVIHVLPRQGHDGTQVFRWQPATALYIPSLEQSLQTEPAASGGLPAHLLKQSLEVRFRQTGERIHLPGRSHSQSVKNFFQQRKIPPWERDRLPFIYYQGKLLAIGDCVTDAFFCRDPDAWRPRLQPAHGA